MADNDRWRHDQERYGHPDDDRERWRDQGRRDDFGRGGRGGYEGGYGRGGEWGVAGCDDRGDRWGGGEDRRGLGGFGGVYVLG